MTTLTLGTSGNYTWYLDYTLTQSTPLNQSTIAYTLRIHRNVSAASGAFWGTPARSFNVTLDGASDTESFSSVDFRVAADINFTSGSVVITHNADGTRSPASVSASVSGSYVSAGFPVPTSVGTPTISLPTIPRAATSITRSGSTETGSATTLTISPLVSTFYYVLKYKSPLTGAWTLIGAAGGIVGSSWPYSTTIAHGEIPNATSGTVDFQVTTLDSSGGTQIGTAVETGFTYTVPASVLPVAGAVTWTEGAGTAGLSTLTNSAAVFCQGWSKLMPTFSSTAGTGASVSSAVATASGVSGNTTSGVAFANVITTQGVSSTFVATVTDSRGRTDTESGTISPSVHRWSLPTANAGTIVATPTGGTQTLALSGATATSTSFYLSGSQRNVLETRLGYRDITTAGAWTYGSWTAQSLSADDATDNAWAPGAAQTVATALDPTHEYEVTLQVRDIFGLNAVNYSNGLTYIASSLIVGAQDVLMSFDGNSAVGIKKIPVNGVLDIGGTAYQDRGSGARRLLDTDDLKASPDIQTFSASGTWTKPAGAVMCEVIVISGGGGGGSGRRGASGAGRGGGCGGGGGGFSRLTISASALGATESVTIGAGGTGGPATTVDNTDGTIGGVGGTSSFGSHVSIIGGSGGPRGILGTSGGGAGARSGTTPGAAGGGSSITGTAGSAATTTNTVGGGGAGGGLTTGNVSHSGGSGGVFSPIASSFVGGAAGTNNGGAGGSGATPSIVYAAGGGGGGGGAGVSGGGAGGAGGAGVRGGGGGGGGASLNGSNSGAGGDGGSGYVAVVTYF